ncbi:plasmid replication initiation protein [Oxalobacteraceae bacterium GrIS 1.18]
MKTVQIKPRSEAELENDLGIIKKEKFILDLEEQRIIVLQQTALLEAEVKENSAHDTIENLNSELNRLFEKQKELEKQLMSEYMIWREFYNADRMPGQGVHSDLIKHKSNKNLSLLETAQQAEQRAAQRSAERAATELSLPPIKTYENDSATQLELFLANLVDYSLKDDRDTMEMPVFSLSTKPDMQVWKWQSVDGRRSVEVEPSRLGRATMHDKDFLIFLTSQIMATIKDGETLPQRVRFQLADYFFVTKKKVNKRASRVQNATTTIELDENNQPIKPLSKDPYQLAEEALDRLKFTSVKIRTKNDRGGRRVDAISFIGNWSIVERSPGDGRATIIEVEISEWLRKVVEEKSVLTIAPTYFELRKPLEKRLYEIGKKHCGNQTEWLIGEAELQQKCGSRAEAREFRRMMKEIIKDNNIPDYGIEPKLKADGTPGYCYINKNVKQLASSGIKIIKKKTLK